MNHFLLRSLIFIAISLSYGCSPSLIRNPATLENWHDGRITDDVYIAGRPNFSYGVYQFGDGSCEIVIPEKPKSIPKDLGYPRFLAGDDLERFSGMFPQLSVSVVSTSIGDGSLVSAVDALINYGIDSQGYQSSLDTERARIKKTKLPLTAGIPSLLTFDKYFSEVANEVHNNKNKYSAVGFNFSINQGTGSLVAIDGDRYFLTARHILTNNEEFGENDIGIISAQALSMDNVENNGTSASYLHDSVSSRELLGRNLNIYFHRSGCVDDVKSGRYFVYSIIPSVHNEKDDQLYANVPNDFGDYMGAVSGAGVFLGDKLVGIFLGRGCTGTHGNEHACERGAEKSTKYLRFVGIDRIREALQIYQSHKSNYPVMVY